MPIQNQKFQKEGSAFAPKSSEIAWKGALRRCQLSSIFLASGFSEAVPTRADALPPLRRRCIRRTPSGRGKTGIRNLSQFYFSLSPVPQSIRSPTRLSEKRDVSPHLKAK